MRAVLISVEELEHFKTDLLKAIKQLLVEKDREKQIVEKQWYKSVEVRKLLNISAGKLQQLRVRGLFQSSKIGGVYYYRSEDIKALFDKTDIKAKRSGNEQ